MKKGVKIAIIIGATLIVSGVLTAQIRKAGVRKRLDEALKNPIDEDALGGLDKFLINEAFSTSTFQRSGKATISRLVAREKADLIWNNYSAYLSSNPTAIIGAFNNLGHLHDVSKIAHEFQANYQTDLLEVINTALAEKSKYNLLIGKLKQLPNS